MSVIYLIKFKLEKLQSSVALDPLGAHRTPPPRCLPVFLKPLCPNFVWIRHWYVGLLQLFWFLCTYLGCFTTKNVWSHLTYLWVDRWVELKRSFWLLVWQTGYGCCPLWCMQWVSPKEKSKQGLKTWNFQSMWKFQRSNKKEVEFPGLIKKKIMWNFHGFWFLTLRFPSGISIYIM